MINCAIDVSHHNGTINWLKLPPEITCVMIKSTQGSSYMDPQALRNINGVQDAGRAAIPYHFLDNSPVAKQYANFSTAIDIARNMVVAVDWETVSRTEKRAPISIMEQFGELCKKATGRSPLAYHGMYDLSSPKINGWPWWVPKYGPQPTKLRWLFWQYTQTGSIGGVNGAVDRSWFWGTQEELTAWYENNVMPKGL